MIKVLFFAELEEKVGQREVVLNNEQLRLSEVKDIIKEKYLDLTISPNVMVAVNEDYASDDDIVKTGDTVAFIPPVSGG
ncbi:molybdopterin converting factor subunit 1 [Bacillus sp. FJAT-45350]|uniref:molybdopterin converting factor subunit 1 n=1 Tax=Bacillus sp. FJAT-45350 TaxID=2011014 RepID=UPI000BB6E68A|nr:molybdopterin converting factor subunit 1 [Bacillus sp. FJAT-45350]